MNNNEDNQQQKSQNPTGSTPPQPAEIPQQPQQPQIALQSESEARPGAQYGQAQPVAQSEVSNGNVPLPYSNQQVESNQIQPQKQKSKTLLIIVILVSILLIGGIVLFVMFGSSSDSDNLNNVQTGSRMSSEDVKLNDLQRKNNIAKFISEVSTFQANNVGRVPTFEEAKTELIAEYVLYDDDKTEFNDPATGEQYIIVSGTPGIGEIQYAEASSCSSDAIVPGSKRQAAARALLESGEFYCLSS